MAEVSNKEIRQINENFENVIGTLQLIQNSNFNDAEKLEIFITCARVLSRVGLWCTTLNHNCLHQFLNNCAYGYHFNVDDAIAWLLKYSKAFLSESEYMMEKVNGSIQHVVSEDEDEISLEIEKPIFTYEEIEVDDEELL